MVQFLDKFGIKATKGDTIIFPFVVIDNDKQIFVIPLKKPFFMVKWNQRIS